MERSYSFWVLEVTVKMIWSAPSSKPSTYPVPVCQSAYIYDIYLQPAARTGEARRGGSNVDAGEGCVFGLVRGCLGEHARKQRERKHARGGEETRTHRRTMGE